MEENHRHHGRKNSSGGFLRRSSHLEDTESHSASLCSTSSADLTSTSESSTASAASTNSASLLSKPHKSGNDPVWDAISRIGPAITLDSFRFLEVVGSGDIGTVYLAEVVGVTEIRVAVKVMDKCELVDRNKTGRARTEREILEAVDHPFLPTLYAHVDCEKWTCLVTEFCSGGDLHVLRQLQPAKRFPEAAVRFYAAEVLVVLEYLHMLGIIYRDLKPENILVRDDGHIMLTDFDLSLRSNSPISASLIHPNQIPADDNSTLMILAKRYDRTASCIITTCMAPAVSCFRVGRKRPTKKKTKKVPSKSLPELLAEPVNTRSMSFVGTHEYLAPEIIAGEGHGNAVDWWTLGIFIYELLYGRTPFKGSDHESTLTNIVGRAVEFPREQPMSAAAKDLISCLLNKDPRKRMGSTRGATQIKQHPFFQSLTWPLLRCMSPPYIPPPVTVRSNRESDSGNDDSDDDNDDDDVESSINCY